MRVAAVETFVIENPPPAWGGTYFVVAKLTTDDGVVGYGEGTPWGSTYLPAFARGIRAGVEELAPAILGLDPRRTDVVYRAMNLALPGHPYIKSPLDMACWDIAAKAAGSLPPSMTSCQRFRPSSADICSFPLGL